MPHPSTSYAYPVPTTTSRLVGALTPLYAHLHRRRLPTPKVNFKNPVCLRRTTHQYPCSGDHDYETAAKIKNDDFLGHNGSPFPVGEIEETKKEVPIER